MRGLFSFYIVGLQELMIKRELAKDPELAGESWDRFLPKFKKKNVKRKKPKNETKKKTYTPFPPPQAPSKVDLELESGEYFFKKDEKKAQAKAEKQQKQEESVEESKAKRASSFKAPEEKQIAPAADKDAHVSSGNVKAMAESLKAKSKKKASGGDGDGVDAASMLMRPKRPASAPASKGEAGDEVHAKKKKKLQMF
ncbi:hypothetical protein CYMTET_33222 [Cymbomonas tetramitiformis]|uniref:Uncharacterized protein n=1 Tax=Cymbomonas tetramitiformis TaxID=36881 RepID=A0AAE0KR69_9CHLO|nr:hypothetical protein CYMTET_33222 [Cymbomonas tetramitiformis]